jgi:hypothetical protein
MHESRSYTPTPTSIPLPDLRPTVPAPPPVFADAEEGDEPPPLSPLDLVAIGANELDLSTPEAGFLVDLLAVGEEDDL